MITEPASAIIRSASEYSVIKVSRRNINQGRLPWLLMQKPIIDRLRQMAEITLQGREASFSVQGFIPLENREERYLGIVPVKRGNIFNAPMPEAIAHQTGFLLKDEFLEYEMPFSFLSLAIHSHPYHDDRRSWFSTGDIKWLLHPQNKKIYQLKDPRQIVYGLFSMQEELLKGVYRICLFFIQGTESSDLKALIKYTDNIGKRDPLDIFRAMGFKAAEFSFTYNSADGHIGLIFNRRQLQALINIGFWINMQSESRYIAEDQKELDKYRNNRVNQTPKSALPGEKQMERQKEIERLLDSVINGKNIIIADPITKAKFMDRLETEMEEKGMYSISDIIHRIGIRGVFADKLKAAVEAAVKMDRANPNFKINVNGEEKAFFRENNKVFKKFRGKRMQKLLFWDEINDKYKFFTSEDIRKPGVRPFADIKIEGPNGETFAFFKQKTVRWFLDIGAVTRALNI